MLCGSLSDGWHGHASFRVTMIGALTWPRRPGFAPSTSSGLCRGRQQRGHATHPSFDVSRGARLQPALVLPPSLRFPVRRREPSYAPVADRPYEGRIVPLALSSASRTTLRGEVRERAWPTTPGASEAAFVAGESLPAVIPTCVMSCANPQDFPPTGTGVVFLLGRRLGDRPATTTKTQGQVCEDKFVMTSS